VERASLARPWRATLRAWQAYRQAALLCVKRQVFATELLTESGVNYDVPLLTTASQARRAPRLARDPPGMSGSSSLPSGFVEIQVGVAAEAALVLA